MKIGDKVLVVNKMDSKGTIVAGPNKILGTTQYAIKFDNPEENEIFNPYWISADLLEEVK